MQYISGKFFSNEVRVCYFFKNLLYAFIFILTFIRLETVAQHIVFHKEPIINSYNISVCEL